MLVLILTVMGIILGRSDGFSFRQTIAIPTGFGLGYLATAPLQLWVGVPKSKSTCTFPQFCSTMFSTWIAVFCALAAGATVK
jgi:hypothetical protein